MRLAMCAILCHSASSIMIPHSVILNAYSVILNVVKNLEVSVAVDGSTRLEILRYTQDDIEPTMARRSFVTLRMTLLATLRSECHCTEPTSPPHKSQNHKITQ